MTAWPGLRIEPPLVWMRTIRDGADLTKSVKAVAFCLALHAKPDGTNAHPGWARLAWESGCSKRTIMAALAELEGSGLVWCAERGWQKAGRGGKANNYALTLHDRIGVLATPFEQWLKANGLTGSTPEPARAAQGGKEDPWDS